MGNRMPVDISTQGYLKREIDEAIMNLGNAKAYIKKIDDVDEKSKLRGHLEFAQAKIASALKRL